MFRSLAILAVGLLLSGCTPALPLGSSLSALVGGNPLTELHEQTRVDLSQANFVVVKTNVVGWSKGFSLLGCVTIVPATVSRATSRMYGSAQMGLDHGAQTVANVMVEHSSSYWILFGIPKVEVHADVVEFRPPAAGREDRTRPPAPKPEAH